MPIRRTVDSIPQMDNQLYQPLNSANQRDVDDYKHYYNPSIVPDYHTYVGTVPESQMVNINPHHPDDLTHPRKEWNSADSHWDEQLHQPLTLENQTDRDDIKTYYNPGKGKHSLGMYGQQKKSAVKKARHHHQEKALAQHKVVEEKVHKHKKHHHH